MSSTEIFIKFVIICQFNLKSLCKGKEPTAQLLKTKSENSDFKT